MNGTKLAEADYQLLGKADFARNCEGAAEWLLFYNFFQPTIGTTIQYVRNATENVLEVAGWSDEQVLGWFLKMSNDTDRRPPNFTTAFDEAAVVRVQEVCRTAVCYTLFRRSAPDIAGIGMVVTYYLEAAIATIYLLVLFTDQFGGWKLHPGSHRPLVRVVEAFRESAKPFLDMTIVFALAMLGSALSSNAHSIHEEKRSGLGEFGIYSNVVCLQLAIFSILPALLLYNIVQGLRRRWFRQMVMVFLFVVAMVNIVLADKTRPNVLQQDQWDRLCDKDQGKMILCSLYATYGVFIAVTIFWLCCLKNILHVPAFEDNRLLRVMARYWPPILAVLCCIAMWMMLGLFTAYRERIIAVATTDKPTGFFGNTRDEDNSWQFGQYLALATFFPALLDFGCIVLEGPRAGLEDRLLKPWTVFREQGAGESLVQNQEMTDLLGANRRDQIFAPNPYPENYK